MQVVSVEDQLKQFRVGYKDTNLKWGDWRCSIRILDAKEENKIISDVKSGKAVTYPNDAIKQQEEALEIMKQVLLASSKIEDTLNLTRPFLDKISGSEIEGLYDQYLDLCHQINPEFEDLTPEKVGEIIDAVKKNPASTKDLSTSQLKGIGRYFLETILPTAIEHGSK